MPIVFSWETHGNNRDFLCMRCLYYVETYINLSLWVVHIWCSKIFLKRVIMHFVITVCTAYLCNFVCYICIYMYEQNVFCVISSIARFAIHFTHTFLRHLWKLIIISSLLIGHIWCWKIFLKRVIVLFVIMYSYMNVILFVIFTCMSKMFFVSYHPLHISLYISCTFLKTFRFLQQYKFIRRLVL